MEKFGITRRQILLIATLLLFGSCSGPFLAFPGGSLTGSEESLSAATFPSDGFVIQLETNPRDPYSVHVNAVVIDGALYVDPTEDRAWYQNMVQDKRVRLKITREGSVYTAHAIRERDPDVIEQFETDQIVMRLDPR